MCEREREREIERAVLESCMIITFKHRGGEGGLREERRDGHDRAESLGGRGTLLDAGTQMPV